MRNLKLSQFRDAINNGYLPDNWRQRIRDSDTLIETASGYLALMGDCQLIEGDYYHSEREEHYFCYDDVDDQYILSSDSVSAYGRRGREVMTAESNCIRYRRDWYVERFIGDYDIVILENGDPCSADDCYYWESDNAYHLNPERDDEDEDEDEDEENNLLWNYGSGPTEKYFVDKDSDGFLPLFGWGIEIEKNGMPDFHFDKDEIYRTSGAVLEKDASVDSGFELKTPVYNLFSKETDKKIELLKNFCNVSDTKGAGGHIGFSMPGKTDSELLELCRGWLPLIYAMYKGRIGNTYCKAKKVNKLKEDNEKFQSIRMRGNYIEFRIFSAVKTYETVLFRLNLFRIIASNLGADFSKVISLAISLNSPLHKLLRNDVYKDETKFCRLIETAISMEKQFGNGRITAKGIEKIQTKLISIKNAKLCV